MMKLISLFVLVTYFISLANN